MNPSRPLIFDAHLDLSMNALEWNRDLTRPIEDLRLRESGRTDKPDRGRGTVCLPEMRAGNVGICVATQIARVSDPRNPMPGWNSPAQAWAQTQGQWSWYRAMEDAGEMVQITDATTLAAHHKAWNEHPETETNGPIGYILSLEGADSIRTPSDLETAFGQGLRAIGPAHYGPGRYAYGTESNAPLSKAGRELLKEMARLNLILDVTHLCDECFWEVLDAFPGPVWASHCNARALVPHHRQLADEQIRHLIGRGAVIGGALDAWMMVPDWVRGTTTPESSGVRLRHLVDHIDHICQLAGNAEHAGIGTDLDGGFGREHDRGSSKTAGAIPRARLRGRRHRKNIVAEFYAVSGPGMERRTLR